MARKIMALVSNLWAKGLLNNALYNHDKYGTEGDFSGNSGHGRVFGAGSGGVGRWRWCLRLQLCEQTGFSAEGSAGGAFELLHEGLESGVGFIVFCGVFDGEESGMLFFFSTIGILLDSRASAKR